LTVELVDDVPRDIDHKSSKFDDDLGGAAGEAFGGAAAEVVGTADIGVRTDVVGDSGVELDHKLPGNPPAGAGKDCLFVGESVEVSENAAGTAGLTCVREGLIMNFRLTAGGLDVRSISINVGLAGGGAAADVGGDEDGAAWKSAKSSSA